MGDRLKLDRWLSMAEAAQLAGVGRRTLLRRLWLLHNEIPGGLLKRMGARKLFVSADALERALRTDPGLRDTEAEAFASRLEDFERKVLALRNSHKALRKRVSAVEKHSSG